MRMIDGDALIDNICRYASPEMAWDRLDVVHKINEMPTIEERKGKWIPYLSHGLTVMCSKCGSRFDRPWHYCPNCGAKMEHNEDDQNV